MTLPAGSAALPVVVFWMLAFVSSALAERATVYLRNGGQATGEIIVHLPEDRTTLDLGNGERVTFAASEIAEVRKEAAPSAAAPATAPAPSAAAFSPPPAQPTPPVSDPMNWFGLSLKIGLRATVNTKKDAYILVDIERTPEFNLGFGLNFGGDGFGWALEPGLSVGKAYFKTGDITYERTPDATLVSISLYTGPTYTWHLSRALYLALGAGPRGSYGFWKKGMAKANPIEVAARIPVTATFYLRSQLALVVELGLGGGKSWWLTDYLGGNGASAAFTADFGAGLRLP